MEWDGVRWYGVGSYGMKYDAMQWNEKGCQRMPRGTCLSLEKYGGVDMSSSTTVEWRPKPEIFRNVQLRAWGGQAGPAASQYTLLAHPMKPV